mgnify:CR=1 FL=1
MATEPSQKAGKEVKGSLEADNKDLAMAELRRQELTVIDLGEQSFLTKDIDIQIGGWPKARDLSVMCRQFVSMTKAGVSILESLKMLCEQTENKRLQDALKEVASAWKKVRPWRIHGRTSEGVPGNHGEHGGCG